jgi:hypothetical protein
MNLIKELRSPAIISKKVKPTEEKNNNYNPGHHSSKVDIPSERCS